MSKKTYRQPKLTSFGNVEAITLQGTIANADTPRGTVNTAFPSAG